MNFRRLVILEILLFLFSAVLLGRLFYWQVYRHDDFTVVAKTQVENTVHIGANRGKILAADGSILVSNQKSFLVYAILPEIRKLKKENESSSDFAKEIADKLSPIVLRETLAYLDEPSQKDRDLLKERISGKIVSQLQLDGLIWVPLIQKVEQHTKEEIEKLEITGIGFEKDTKRFYPEGHFAANLLGFVGKDIQGNDSGYFGIEGFFDSELKGRSGTLIQEVDALGRPILSDSPEGLGALDGGDIYTTIDKSVQYTVERKLVDGVRRYGAKSGAVIVLEPETGKLLASASTPTFNIFDPPSSSEENYKNLGISEVYEPGSTFKSITFAASLDSGKIKLDTICPCKGPIKASGYEVQTSDNKYHPNSTVAEILQHSDNVGAAFAGQKMGKDTFLEYIETFGFGIKSGIGIQGEEAGIIKKRRDWHDIELVNASFGQGLSVTPLQMVNAIAAIANDGALMKPFVVRKIVSPKNEIKFDSKKVRQVIKPETAKLMQELLLSAVEEGEAKKLIPHGYRVAGKTGTAQIPIPGGYSTKTVATFVGFGPVENPKFAMIVVLFEPSASIFASETSEPLFFKMIEELYPYWGIPVHQE